VVLLRVVARKISNVLNAELRNELGEKDGEKEEKRKGKGKRRRERERSKNLKKGGEGLIIISTKLKKVRRTTATK